MSPNAVVNSSADRPSLAGFRLAICASGKTCVGWHRSRTGVTAVPQPFLQSLADALLMHANGMRLVAALPHHQHLYGRLPRDQAATDRLLSRLKQSAALRMKPVLHAPLFARGFGIRRVTDPTHHRNTLAYIRRHVHEGAALAERHRC